MEEIKPDNSIKPQRCGWAILSLILGVLGIFLGIFGMFLVAFGILIVSPIMAVIFGIITLLKIRPRKGLLVGKGSAIAGIILGMMPLITSIFPDFLPVTIPFILSSRVYKNEASAVRSLKLMVVSESTWSAQDTDENGIGDCWTYDVSCLYRGLRRDYVTKVAFIPLELAMADAKPAKTDVFSNGDFRISDLPGEIPVPYNGYYFRMMELDQNSKSYKKGKVNGILATGGGGFPFYNFAIVAYPAIYGVTGVNTYIVNGDGYIYYTDCGSDARKIILQWPGNKPAEIGGPSGKRWRVAD